MNCGTTEIGESHQRLNFVVIIRIGWGLRSAGLKFILTDRLETWAILLTQMVIVFFGHTQSTGNIANKYNVQEDRDQSNGVQLTAHLTFVRLGKFILEEELKFDDLNVYAIFG